MESKKYYINANYATTRKVIADETEIKNIPSVDEWEYIGEFETYFDALEWVEGWD